jgi:hypothetical protein
MKYEKIKEVLDKIIYKNKVEKKGLYKISKELGFRSSRSLYSFAKENPELFDKIKSTPFPKLLNLKGKQFGWLKVIEPTEKRSAGGGVIWKCECQSCKKIIEISGGSLKYNHSNRSCGCQPIIRKDQESVGELKWRYLNALKHGCKRKSRELEFAITLEYAWGLFLKQDRKCALSGVEISVRSSASRKIRQRQTASLDRIDSSKGYIEGNVQWVHKDINGMKNNLSDCQFIAWCKKIAEFSKEKCLNEELLLNESVSTRHRKNSPETP